MKSKKIIFLDFDGPMLPTRSYFLPKNYKTHAKVFDPIAVAMINRLLDVSNAAIVVSSAWAKFEGYDAVVKTLGDNGISTSRLHDDWTIPRGADSCGNTREMEIKLWLAAHSEVTHYVAIDDIPMNLPGMVYVSLNDGMLYDHAFKAAALLDVKLI